MLTIEHGGKTVTTTDDSQKIIVNGQELKISVDDKGIYVEDERINGWISLIPYVLAMIIGLTTWYTLFFTESGIEFFKWVFS